MVAVQQSRAPVRESGAPGRGSRCSLGPRAAPPPQLLEQGAAALLCYPPRVAPGKRAWLHSPSGPGGGARGQRGPSLPSFLSRSALPAGTRVLPRGEALGPHVAACHLKVTSPGLPPFHSFPVRVGRGVRWYLLCAELKVCDLQRKSHLLPPAHNLPNPGEIQEEALMMEGW